MKSRWLVRTIAVLLLGFAGGLARAQEITGNHRFLENFEMDGAILRQGWLEAGAGYSNWGGGRDFTLGTRVAFSAMDRLEMGGRLSYLSRTRSRGEVLFGEKLSSSVDENGLGDLESCGRRKGAHKQAAGLALRNRQCMLRDLAARA